MGNNFHNHQGIRNVKPIIGDIEIDSIKFNHDVNFNKPLNEVSEEIQRRKDRAKVSSI